MISDTDCLKAKNFPKLSEIFQKLCFTFQNTTFTQNVSKIMQLLDPLFAQASSIITKSQHQKQMQRSIKLLVHKIDHLSPQRQGI